MTINKSAILKRPSWDTYFMQIADLISTRATCVKRKVGAIIVKEKQILATGYNGAPKNHPHCSATGCLRKQLQLPSGANHELCRGLHAEQNAIIQAASCGVSIKGALLYCTFLPCVICAKMILNAGIKKVIFSGYYPDDLSVQMFADSKVELTLFEEKFLEEEIKEADLSEEEKSKYKVS